ncbi:MAG: orotate phosphoribosyltransferase [Ginsengibacter sp.]
MQDTQIANYLLDIKAIKINVTEPFTWTSGIKSPIYCDCRRVNSFVKERDAVINKFTDIIKGRFLSNTNVIAGVASGGISYGVLVADRLDLPFIYVREERKKHGLKKEIEGEYQSFGNRVVLIEDHISTGGSSMKAVNSLRDEHLEVNCLLSIMTYGFKEANDAFYAAGILHDSLCNLDTILEVALQRQIINSADADKIRGFRESQTDWQP